jgi:hypothetical protein
MKTNLRKFICLPVIVTGKHLPVSFCVCCGFVYKASAFFVLTEVKLQALATFFFHVLCSTSRMYELLMILETRSMI